MRIVVTVDKTGEVGVYTEGGELEVTILDYSAGFKTEGYHSIAIAGPGGPEDATLHAGGFYPHEALVDKDFVDKVFETAGADRPVGQVG